MKDASHTSSLTFSAVPPTLLDVVWSDASPLLARAVETSGGRFTIESVYESIKTGHIALWLVLDGTRPIAALTTRVSQLPTKRVMAIDWVGGKRMNEWIEMVLSVLEEYSQRYGCSQLQGFGRKAWGRYLSRYGWEEDYIAYKKDLSDE